VIKILVFKLLEDPKEFAGTVDALFAAQKHAIDVGKDLFYFTIRLTLLKFRFDSRW